MELVKKENLPIVKQFKTNKEVIVELVDFVFEQLSQESGAQMMMLKPALNIGKLKLSQMTEQDADNLVLKIHNISNLIERETGILSPYHCSED